MKPVYKIETYTGAQLDHTITDEAPKVYFKNALTNQVGNFEIWLKTVKGIPNPYYYGDIAVNDKVKIWVGYDSVSGNPDFVGKVQKIEGPLSTDEGYVRRITGYDLGEILLRRLKKDTQYSGTGASTIVEEWATDLSLGDAVDADATAVYMTITTKNYFDLLRAISDYWYSGAVQIKKDFYVDISNNLVWKDRPLRTEGVDTLAIGKNILNYQVVELLEPVKNKIYVYGAEEYGGFPTDFDNRTEQDDSETPADDHWLTNDENITFSWMSADKKVGNECLLVNHTTGEDPTVIEFWNQFSGANINALPYVRGKYTKLKFWFYAGYYDYEPTISQIRLYDPTNDYFYKTFDIPASQTWEFFDLPIGEDAGWDASGSPEWDEIIAAYWAFSFPLNFAMSFRIDNLYFARRAYDDAEDATSQSNYGVRELEIIDDRLGSDSECQQRAETLLYMKKDPPTQIEITVKPGSNNLLIGDRIPITIPAEGISAQNYDVLSVEQLIMGKPIGFTSKVTMVNTANIRQSVPRQPTDKMFQLNRAVRELNIQKLQI